MSAARFGEIVFGRLSATAAVTALVGTSPVRIYPGMLRQSSTLPGIVYQVVFERTVNSLAGYTSQKRAARVQIDCYAKTYTEAQDVADAVTGALGTLATPTLAALPVARRDLYEDELQLHRVSTEFSLWSDDT